MDELKPPPMPKPTAWITVVETLQGPSSQVNWERMRGTEHHQLFSEQQMKARDAQWLALVGELQRDAERYRWLRDALSDRSRNGVSHYFCSISEGYPEELDFAIDSVFAARGEKGGDHG